MVTVEEAYLPITLWAPGISDGEFQRLCAQYEDYRVEYTADGELIVMPPTDENTGSQNSELIVQLGNWAYGRGGGTVTDSSTAFLLPNGARRCPDAAWISWERVGKRPNCPEFVIELLSPSDRIKTVRAKMQEWIDNGAQLAWMIDPRSRVVTVYRPNAEPEVLAGVDRVAGEGPVDGFVLLLDRVWNPFRRS